VFRWYTAAVFQTMSGDCARLARGTTLELTVSLLGTIQLAAGVPVVSESYSETLHSRRVLSRTFGKSGGAGPLRIPLWELAAMGQATVVASEIKSSDTLGLGQRIDVRHGR